MVEKFDCVYNMYDDGEEIPYCRRPDGPQSVKRKKIECDNGGEKKLFRDLINEKIHPNNILKWSSSVEMADLYAALFYNRSSTDDNDDRFLCNCTKPGTFGKYCEYQLTHNARTWSHAIESQFKEKKDGDSWNTQRYGKILCYKTLPCPSSPLCLDWREICDGIQRCVNGTDEENWDKLEFNECEDDEFRCSNGMCIPEQFWLDTDLDCMDWTDEYFYGYGEWCPFEARSLKCDEHLCMIYWYSCGDGQCVEWFTRMAFQRIGGATNDCFTKRNLNYMCEASPHQAAWTLESGLCWPDQGYDDPRYPPWNMMSAAKLSDDEKCVYLFRCAWSKGFEHGCPCNHQNCTKMLTSVCRKPNHLISYPPEGLINPNILFLYDYRQPMENSQCKLIGFQGNTRCRGFLKRLQSIGTVPFEYYLMAKVITNHIICTSDFSTNMYEDFSSPYRHDLFCWNDSLTFNGRRYAVYPDICPSTRQCISQYRIHDSILNCLFSEDELTITEKNYCTGNVGRQRFQCYDDQHKCLDLTGFASGHIDCSNSYDERYFGTGDSLQIGLLCQKNYTAQCHRVKEYIQQSSLTNSSNNTEPIHFQRENQTDSIHFQSYCDSFWDLDTPLDEMPSSCQYWVCDHDQYQCRTGQCIRLDWVCDGEWDCTDASDEEGIELIKKQWLGHNAALPGLPSQVEKCEKLYSKSPFSRICNRSSQLGCYRSGVKNPLNIRLNHPCINLTQIGDGVEDCFNAYDERNTFMADSGSEKMWGFRFRCKGESKRYVDACHPKKETNCSEILCSYYRDQNGSCSDVKDWICLEDDRCHKSARCNKIVDCTNGEDEYWCSNGSLVNQLGYRINKNDNKKSLPFGLETFPGHFLTSDKQQLLKRTIHFGSDSPWKIPSYQCNRGVAVLQSNETECFCPPAYYGRWCEFYSDRISIIAHLNHSTLPKSLSNITLKIKANFLYNNQTIDQHQFNIIPTLEKNKIIKHRFYLLYSRSEEMIEHKRNRYSNRADVISHHPYSVRFDVFVLEENRRVQKIGSWYYPIYFDYLPAFRLAIVLRFPSWFGNVLDDPCHQSACNANSSCLPVLNQNNSYYCSCKSGYYGRNCEMYESQCDDSCSVDGFCEVNNLDLKVGEKEISCICPLGHFGSGCNLKYDQCDENSCLNNGICFSTYDQSGEEPFVCNCSERFEGKRCEAEQLSIHVHLNMTRALSACPTVVQLYDHMNYFLRLFLEHQQVYRQLPSVIKSYGLTKGIPTLGILKVYEDWSNPQYFVMYMYLENQRTINITSSPQLCPHVVSLLPKDIDQSVRVFHYHHICRNDTERFCFYDENYLCICQSDHKRVHCFNHDTQLDHCDQCLSGGKCLQGNSQDANDFTCFCPSCYQGHRCQFSFQAFGFTLDSLLIDQSKEIKIVYAVLVVLIFVIAIFNNICSLVTFKRPTPRKFGVGYYLLIVTCLNKISLFFLLFKFIEITLGSFGIGSCRAISYSLSAFTRSTYWLTSGISVDRLLTTIFPMAPCLKNARLAMVRIVVTLVIIFGVHVHEIISYTVIKDLSTASLVCVTNFDTGFISTYNRVSTLIHYICPFFIQIISIALLVFLATRSRSKTAGQKVGFAQILKKQFWSQKELYITPTIIIFCALPQMMLTFSFACTQLSHWQRHTLLVSYLLSYIPQLLGFILYVIPSSTYKKEFSDTMLAKKCFKCMLGSKMGKV